MLPAMRPAPAPFDSSDWIFELKHDGFRALTYIADGRCQLVSRKNNPYKSFGRLREALAGLRLRDAVLDGEIVCLDDEGRSQFNQLLRRRGTPVFYAFDLLWLNGEDLRQLPLVRRKERLRRLIVSMHPLRRSHRYRRNERRHPIFAKTNCAP
jgi:bifunctional non-homologous end joining protein LigD